MFPDRALEKELLELHAEQTSYGWRIDHGRNKHDDMAMAIGMATLAVAEKGPPKASRQSKALMDSRRFEQRVKIGGATVFVGKDGELSWRRNESWEPRKRGGET